MFYLCHNIVLNLMRPISETVGYEDTRRVYTFAKPSALVSEIERFRSWGLFLLGEVMRKRDRNFISKTALTAGKSVKYPSQGLQDLRGAKLPFLLKAQNINLCFKMLTGRNWHFRTTSTIISQHARTGNVPKNRQPGRITPVPSRVVTGECLEVADRVNKEKPLTLRYARRFLLVYRKGGLNSWLANLTKGGGYRVLVFN